MASSRTARPKGSRVAAPEASGSVAELVEAPECPDARGAPTLLSIDIERAYILADRVLALDQPWRSHFVEYIALRANATQLAGRPPSRSQLAVWLANRGLHRLITVLMRTWDHSA